MRELKFRAWGENQNAYCCFNLENIICIGGEENLQMLNDTLVGGVVIEQYTGLKDKNGKEIYEGDIVNKAYHNIETYDKNGVVEMGYLYDSDGFNNGKIYGWKAGDSSLADVCDECEVIGNIHENPELLKGGE